jgi:hypothetical protein
MYIKYEDQSNKINFLDDTHKVMHYTLLKYGFEYFHNSMLTDGIAPMIDDIASEFNYRYLTKDVNIFFDDEDQFIACTNPQTGEAMFNLYGKTYGQVTKYFTTLNIKYPKIKEEIINDKYGNCVEYGLHG